MRTGSRCSRTWPHKLLGSNKDHWSKDSVVKTKKHHLSLFHVPNSFFISLTNLNCDIYKHLFSDLYAEVIVSCALKKLVGIVVLITL